MPAVTVTLTIRVPPGVVERIDASRGGVSRNAWFVWAAEMALDEGRWVRSSVDKPGAVERALGSLGAPERTSGLEGSIPAPAPAEQPGTSDVERKGLENLVREFRPYPKGGKR